MSTCPVSGESAKEERVNRLTHLVGLWLSLLGLPILIIYSFLYGDFLHLASFTIYSVTLVLLYVASTYYHGCQLLERKSVLRILDHACIYLLIAGSYTPFALGPLREFSGWLYLGIEWGIASIGILLKIFAFHRFQVFSLVAYLVMGWMVVFNFPTLTELVSSKTITLLVSGGLSYTLGVIFFLWNSLTYSHAIWHLFVLAGSVCHYFAVLQLL